MYGEHGIGKTESIIDFARRNDYTYVYCAPAQFEELGDLHGIPETYDPTPEMPNGGDEYTVYRPPQWLRSALENVNPNQRDYSFWMTSTVPNHIISPRMYAAFANARSVLLGTPNKLADCPNRKS